MSVTWIVVADSSRARILTPSSETPKPLDELVQYVGRAGYAGPQKFSSPHLDEVADLVHPQGQMKPQELETDRPGRDKSPGVTESFESSHVDFNHQTAETFAREIIGYLTQARQKSRFDHLVLAAPPLFLGVLRKLMPRALTDLVTREINKEYTKLSADEIQSYLSESE